jgi:hypothetical protein
MQYKVTDKFDKETRDAIIRALIIAEKSSHEKLIEQAKYSPDQDRLQKLAHDVRCVSLASRVLSYEYLSYTEIPEQD